jgi:hypothetical protein
LKRTRITHALVTLALVLAASSPARAQEVQRVVVGLFSSKDERDVRRSRLHRLAEMPLNHLGVILHLHDIRQGLPSDELMRRARGIVTWFSDASIEDPDAYLSWLEAQMRSGKRLVMIGEPGIDPARRGGLSLRGKFDGALSLLGLRWEGEWVALTYQTRVVAKDGDMVEFERRLPEILMPYHRVSAAAPELHVYLSVGRPGRSEADVLVATGPRGGYIAGDYAVFEVPERPGTYLWYIDPFRFFREALATDEIPKPDTTTMSGRRIFYSHIDGDAWHNISAAQGYAGKRVKSAHVILEQILLKYPDLPVTVAPISADLDPDWYGDEEARDLARRIFALAHVEAGTHTHSHPFAWGFFRTPDARREAPYLARYPLRPGKRLAQSVWDPAAAGTAEKSPPADPDLGSGYERPRSYAVRPFDLEQEVGGSIRAIQALLPPGKRVEILQWSGDTQPFARAVALVADAGIRNINGGDPRMDGANASYAQVSPLGARVGTRWQIYSSGSNENIYTANWRARFFAFRGLAESLARMDAPIRIKPINIYYHLYSGEREDGLNAVRFNLDYARRQELAPIATSRFAAMADGFYSARILRLGDDHWRVEDRDGIETLRFDHASLRAVDFARSRGVIGQRHVHGSLYVALDRAVDAPEIALRDHPAPFSDPDAPQPYLVQSRWRVERLVVEERAFRFRASGFGPGEFVWRLPAAGRYEIAATAAKGEPLRTEASVGSDHLLRLTLALAGEAGIDVEISPKGTAP